MDEKLESGQKSTTYLGKKDEIEKTYLLRESMINELCKKNEHLNSLLNLITTFLFIYLVHYLVVDCFLTSEAKKDWDFFWSRVEGFDQVFIDEWIPMLLVSILAVYYGFRLWALGRRFVTSLYILGMVDFVFLLGFVTYIGLFFTMPLRNLSTMNFAPKCFIILEQVRMLMKSYAFVRSNIPKVVQSDQVKLGVQIPRLSQYVYFMFAPVMVYKDEYPRTLRVRWSLVASNMVKFVHATILVCLITRRIIIPFLSNINLLKTKIYYFYFWYILYSLGLATGFVFFSGFFGFFQFWLNMWAELLRFGDRHFYMEFWTVSSIGSFLRLWNLVVQDWIYIYLYRDFKIIFKNNRNLTVLFSLMISQMLHDYVLTCVTGTFFPMFMYFYAIAFLLLDFKLSGWAMWNGIILTTLILSFSCILTVSILEWYSIHTYHCSGRGYWIMVPKFLFCS